MSSQHFIQSFVLLRNRSVVHNGQQIFKASNATPGEFLKAVYQQLQLDYPKFYKMDDLCKLAFLGAEIILNDIPDKKSSPELAVVLSNASSTLETDRKHEESITSEENYFPSPAVFVYTLPNITIGEIAIRHKLQGENTFLISKEFDIPLIHPYTGSMLLHQRASLVLSGWVEVNAQGYDGFLYLTGIEKTGLSIEHTQENIDILYKTGHSI